jgi:hypothetical protein
MKSAQNAGVVRNSRIATGVNLMTREDLPDNLIKWMAAE